MTERPRRAPPTLEQVAAAAGVSRATVSRVVNGSSRVSPTVRAKVESAISALGYVPNPAARSLVTGRSGSVALVVHEPGARVFAEPFFGGMIRGVAQTLAEHELQMVVLFASSDHECARIARFLSRGHADGALLISLHGADPLLAALERARVPLVLLGRPLGRVAVQYVDADNRSGARDATAHLLAGGRQCIATIAGPTDMAVGLDRLEGYRDALRAAGVAPSSNLIEHADFSEASGADAMRALLARAPALDAVFAASDLMAVGAMAVLREAGRAVPASVAVVGFEDSPAARQATPPLTSVHQSTQRFATEMVRLLLDQLAGVAPDPARPVLVPTSLVVRASS
ncbi:MAG: LacI family DNA-binding transcriptional regulator [Frankia sp.]